VFFKSLKKVSFSVKLFFPFAKLKISAHFRNQRKIPLLVIPFADYFEDFFLSTLIMSCATFLVDKGSTKIKTAQYF
jgi:hypothetical protein